MGRPRREAFVWSAHSLCVVCTLTTWYLVHDRMRTTRTMAARVFRPGVQHHRLSQRSSWGRQDSASICRYAMDTMLCCAARLVVLRRASGHNQCHHVLSPKCHIYFPISRTGFVWNRTVLLEGHGQVSRLCARSLRLTRLPCWSWCGFRNGCNKCV